MHSDHDLEKEIRFILRGSRLQEPPKELLNNFEDQVWGRITDPRPQGSGLLSAAAILILLLLIASYAFWLLQPAPLSMPESKTPEEPRLVSAPSPEIKKAVISDLSNVPAAKMLSDTEKEPGLSDDALDRHIKDLLILEWLGEADGLLEDFNQLPGAIEATVPKPL